MKSLEARIAQRLNDATAQADTTKKVLLGAGILNRTPACFTDCFGDRTAVIVADANTYAAAGRDVQEAFLIAGFKTAQPLVLDDDDLYAEYRFAEKIASYLRPLDAIPVAVGSGTINDLVKLAAHQCQRPYMIVATAASMDGYTAFGASITKDGFKQTMTCPAPIAVVADMNVIENAPVGMNASGYADLIAKIPAGADWLVANALGVEPIDPKAWTIIQSALRDWVSDPAGVKTNCRAALLNLTEGLIMGGLAMQAAQSSRPASGAEHQFSHLWDGDHHTHNGVAPSHGFKVGIGTICSEALYENILHHDLSDLSADPDHIRQWWPQWNTVESTIVNRFADPELAEQIIAQSKAKYLTVEDLSARMTLLASVWPELREKLKAQLLGPATIGQYIKAAGAPSLPTEIGIDYARLHHSFRDAQLIRQRYTVLDIAVEAGVWTTCVDALFAKGGFWAKYSQRTPHVVTAIHTENTKGVAYQKATL